MRLFEGSKNRTRMSGFCGRFIEPKGVTSPRPDIHVRFGLRSDLNTATERPARGPAADQGVRPTSILQQHTMRLKPPSGFIMPQRGARTGSSEARLAQKL